ncbi:MAG: AAA family ATPase [Candidatus Anstonellaceae archaeon]
MGKAILITGVPGTGKSTLAAALCKKLEAALLDINKLALALKLYSHTDSFDNSKVVRLRELEEELVGSIKAEARNRDVVVEGHLGCEMKLPVSKAIVLRCHPRKLRQRLSLRGYNEGKIHQNALAEALDYCTVMAEKNLGKRRVWEIDTTSKSPAQVLSIAQQIILGKKKKKERVSFPDAMQAEAISGKDLRKAMEKR